jgi:3-phosphoshikimate 1-carboxyvinyltransferase
MTARLLPGPTAELSGAAEVPTSKSLSNRALIAAAAAGGGRIHRPLDCDDTRLLAGALAAAGWSVAWRESIEIGPRRAGPTADLNLGNSGTGARLALGLLACVDGRFRVDGSDRLRERPMRPLIDALIGLGCEIAHRNGFLPVEIVGRRLEGGAVRIRPEVSSQFVSALLLAAPLMERGLELCVEGEVPSRPYLDLTVQVMEAFGASAAATGMDRWSVAPGGYRPTDITIEADWSAAAFPAAAVAVSGGRVLIPNLRRTSRQGDRALAAVLERAGVEVRFDRRGMTVCGRAVRSFEADLKDTPDLFPALAVVAAAAPQGSILTGLDHLRHKESDRRSVMIDNLGRLGAVVRADGARLRIERRLDAGRRSPVSVSAADDHRIAMAMAVAALASGPVEIDDDRCVAKSFPGFWAMWERLLKRSTEPP